ncbi:MAG: hypothetical protein JNL34_07105 [Anaerolineae bacterium]|nr:hypothetical protein [Anaerolineae bacterium]
MTYMCVELKVGFDIDWIRSVATEQEADEFARETSGYRPIDPELDPPDFYKKYDPPMVLVVEGEEIAFETGKWDRPVAIYVRGERWDCAREPTDSPVERQ